MFAKLPTMGKKAKETHACICGCGLPTKSTWHSGHDGRATGWAVRVEKGLMSLADVPANERQGAELRLRQRGFTFPVVDVPADGVADVA